MPCGKKRIRNWECKMPRENWKGKKRIRNAMEEKILGSKGTNKKIFSKEIKYCFQIKNTGHQGWDIPLRFARFARFVNLKGTLDGHHLIKYWFLFFHLRSTSTSLSSIRENTGIWHVEIDKKIAKNDMTKNFIKHDPNYSLGGYQISKKFWNRFINTDLSNFR